MINIRGITLSLHPFFVILMLFSVMTGHFLELIVLFAIVFIHELGHLAAALLSGVRIRSVQMLPFGGVVEIEDHGQLTAWKEIGIALAGPAMNAAMIGGVLLLREAGWGNGAFLSYVVYGNAMIAELQPAADPSAGRGENPACRRQPAVSLPPNAALVLPNQPCGQRSRCAGLGFSAFAGRSEGPA